MAGRGASIARQPADNTPLQACDPVATRPKPGPEQHVLFKAASAALVGDHLLLKRRYIELGQTPEHDIQRFVGD
jgi:hypothetical protein